MWRHLFWQPFIDLTYADVFSMHTVLISFWACTLVTATWTVTETPTNRRGIFLFTLQHNTVCRFNSCFQTPQLFWVNSVEPLLQFQSYLPPITCALHFIVMTRRKEEVFFSSTVLFHHKSLNHHPLQIIPVSSASLKHVTPVQNPASVFILSWPQHCC